MRVLSGLSSPPVASAQVNSPGSVSSSGHTLTVDNVTHQFGSFVALKQINLEIQPGELVALLGPSGCGKTTLLRAIAGFIKPSSGHILIDGQRVEHVPTNKRGVGVVFQNYALFPHMTVQDNIAYGLRAQGFNSALANAKVEEMLALVKLSQMRDRFPSQLSGGQQQRVALARALAVEPRILLLDESFSALDKNLRLDMQIEVKRLVKQQGITTIFVTHDQEEALSMADRIAVMSQGLVQQFGTPTEIYDRPASVFVSKFVGTSNLLPARLAGWDNDGFGLVDIEPGSALRIGMQITPTVGESLYLSIRPENFHIFAEPGFHRIAGMIEVVLPLGSTTVYDIRTNSGIEVKVTQPRVAGSPLLEPGQQIYLELVSPQACSVFTNE
jgi:putative spermidine/putrescine transport system ATP-binding protein